MVIPFYDNFLRTQAIIGANRGDTDNVGLLRADDNVLT